VGVAPPSLTVCAASPGRHPTCRVMGHTRECGPGWLWGRRQIPWRHPCDDHRHSSPSATCPPSGRPQARWRVWVQTHTTLAAILRVASVGTLVPTSLVEDPATRRTASTKAMATTLCSLRSPPPMVPHGGVTPRHRGVLRIGAPALLLPQRHLLGEVPRAIGTRGARLKLHVSRPGALATRHEA